MRVLLRICIKNKMEKRKSLNNNQRISFIWGGTMQIITRRVLLSAVGGGLIVLGILSGYNMLAAGFLYSIPAIFFLAGGIFAIVKAFD